MNNNQINPNFVAAVLIGFTVLALAVLPIRIEVVPNQVDAQPTDTNVAQATEAETIASSPMLSGVCLQIRPQMV